MENVSSDYLQRASHAKDQLVAQFINHPDVTMIDVGFEPTVGAGEARVVVRIHVRKHWLDAKAEDRTAFPAEFEGIPVVVIPGEYLLE